MQENPGFFMYFMFGSLVNTLRDSIFIAVVYSYTLCLSGGSVPAAGEHTETLQEALQNPNKTWIEQSPASRGMIQAYLFKKIFHQRLKILFGIRNGYFFKFESVLTPNTHSTLKMSKDITNIIHVKTVVPP